MKCVICEDEFDVGFPYYEEMEGNITMVIVCASCWKSVHIGEQKDEKEIKLKDYR